MMAMNKWNTWIKAMRLRTLPLALASIGMGSFVAAFHHSFRPGIFALCVLTTLLLQILSNLANDYGDSIHGADSQHREGPARQVQSGHISQKEMRNAIVFTSVLALLSGLSLLKMSFGKIDMLFIAFFLLGIAAIGAAVKYTMGRNPYGYAGLGDLFVLLFFGIVGVAGSYYLQAKQLPISVFLPAFSFGLLSTAVLNLNNIRDIQSDKAAGKFSIPVRIGRRYAVAYHWLLLSGAFFLVVVFTVMKYKSPWQFIFLLTLPLFIKNALAVRKYEKASDLDPYLKQLAISSLLFTISFGVGLILTLKSYDNTDAYLTLSLLHSKLEIYLNTRL